MRPSTLETTFCVTTTQSRSWHGVPCGARRVDDELGEHVAGADLGDALDGDEGQATGQPRTDQATAASACRASAAATRASRITVSATIARTPCASTSGARASSPASITSVEQKSR